MLNGNHESLNICGDFRYGTNTSSLIRAAFRQGKLIIYSVSALLLLFLDISLMSCRYVTPGAFIESAMYAGLSESDLKDWSLLAKVRYAVYRPGGPMAMDLSQNPTVLVVNDTAFVHGGLLPAHGECFCPSKDMTEGLEIDAC